MAIILLMAAVFYGIGRALGVRSGLLLACLGVVLLAILAVQLATGGSVANWLILAGAMAVVWTYVQILGRLKNKALNKVETASDGSFSNAELERYARHIVLREIGGAGQQRLKGAKVLVIGAGGLGSPALMYLAAAGVGTIGVVDDDEVSLSNLQRQILHSDARIDMPKVFSAETALNAINPHVDIRPYQRRLDAELARALLEEYDLVLDGCDNFETRYLVNAACVAAGKPLISGAISQWEGQVSLFDPAKGAPCYACIFPKPPADGLAPSCAEAGVMGALPGVVGSMMATEAIKHITGAGQTLKGEMLIYDALYGETRKVTLAKDAACTVCGTQN